MRVLLKKGIFNMKCILGTVNSSKKQSVRSAENLRTEGGVQQQIHRQHCLHFYTIFNMGKKEI